MIKIKNGSFNRAEITQNYQPYWALKASLLLKLGKSSEAIIAYDITIGLSQDEAVKNYLRKKIIFFKKQCSR